MLVFKSVHEALLAAKDSQIRALQDEVRWLRNYLQPQRGSYVTIPEANAILDGRQDQIDAPVAPPSLEVLAERDRILSGTY